MREEPPIERAKRALEAAGRLFQESKSRFDEHNAGLQKAMSHFIQEADKPARVRNLIESVCKQTGPAVPFARLSVPAGRLSTQASSHVAVAEPAEAIAHVRQDSQSMRSPSQRSEAAKASTSIPEAFSVDDLAENVASTTRQALGHAQTSLDTAHANWRSLLAGTSRWADEAGIGPRPSTGPNPLEAAFGELWNDAGPRMNPFKAPNTTHAADDLRAAGRHITIVTTASLPWMTGTSINPLLRAHYLSESGDDRQVTLVVPWLSLPDQKVVFPNSLTFETPEQQEQYVRRWVRERTGKENSDFKVSFYPSRYAPEKGSILPVGDLTSYIPEHEADVAILEEPEHLNWYHHGTRWTRKFNHVVGIMHTNYLDYARREDGGALKELFLRTINSWVCRAHTHKVIKLSDAVQRLPRQCTQFVHGVSPRFLEVGAAKSAAAAAALAPDGGGASAVAEPVWGRGAYFLGKVVWAKGYTELLDLLAQHKHRTGASFPLDIYGSGDDLHAVEAKAKADALPLTFHGPQDHADASLQDFKVFVNPSLSDVVATTTAEALAMGKWVVCAEHPCNKFFSTFDNCIIYKTPEEFAEKLQFALAHDPKPLTPSDLDRLSWEAATERFLDAAALAPHERRSRPEALFDSVAAAAHNSLTGIEAFRVTAGAGAATLATPQRVTDYVASADDTGGFFDNRERASNVRKQKRA